MAKKSAKASKPRSRKRSGNPTGRPKKPIIGPTELHEIGLLWLKGEPLWAIAQKFGVADATIQGHIDRHIRPAWKTRCGDDMDALRAEILKVKQENWRRYQSGECTDLQDVKWSVEQGLKIAGGYAATKIQHEHSGDLRVAGPDPSAFTEEFMRRLAEKIAERKAYLAAHPDEPREIAEE